jgi:hypothetical protein
MMKPARIALWLATASLALSGIACAAPAADDGDGAQADAISAKAAATEFKGAKQIYEGPATSSARAIGVTTWSVFAVKQDSFTGTVMFAVDRAGDVKYAVLAGQRSASSSGDYSFALVNYDKAGKTAASSSDKATLETLYWDVRAIDQILTDREKATAKTRRDCATGIAVVAVSALVAGASFWIAGGVAGATAGGAWVVQVLGASAATSFATVGVLGAVESVYMTVITGLDLVDANPKSCGALL